MLALNHILIPIDFSNRSLGMVRYMLSFARTYCSRVTLLHVAEAAMLFRPNPHMPGQDATVTDEQHRARLSDRLATVGADNSGEVSISRVVESGDPSERITTYARNQSVDLIAIPTHGHGPVRQFLLGSVTAKVLHDASCPVLTGSHLEATPAAEQIEARRILCSIDLGPHSGDTLKFANQLADDLHAELHVVHVVEVPAARLSLNFGADWETGLMRIAKDHVHDLQRDVGANGGVFIKLGNSQEQVCELAGRIHADLLVIGRGAPGRFGGRLRSNAYGLIRSAPCPVISV